MKNKTAVISRHLICSLLITFGILLAPHAHTADELPKFSVEFQKKGLSVAGSSVSYSKGEGFFLTGQLHEISGPSTWGWLAKVNNGGSKKWQRELGKKAKNSSFYASSTTRHGDVVFAGTAHERYGTLGSALAWLVKTDRNGKLLWDKTLVIGQVARAVDVKLLNGDKILVLVTSKRDAKDFISVLKFDSTGNEISRKEISISDSVIGKYIYPLPDGSFTVVGTRFSSPDFKNNVWVARFDEHGNMLWEQLLRDAQGKASAGVILPDNDILLARLEGLGVGLRGTHLSLIKVSESGDVLWNKKISTPDVCGMSALWVSFNGKLLASGTNCDVARARVWTGEVFDDGKLRLLKVMVSINGAEIVTMLPVDKKIAVVLQGKADSGDSPTWLLVGSNEEIE